MGHEFTGEVVETGSAVKTVKKGDRIVSPFTTSWYVGRYPNEDTRGIRLIETNNQTAGSASIAKTAFPHAVKSVCYWVALCWMEPKLNMYAPNPILLIQAVLTDIHI